ncbi:MAG: phosphoenolpyruvate carboxylase, partial [Cyclobacteriaceae bacterium]
MNPTLTDASLDVPAIQESLAYLEQQLTQVLIEDGYGDLAKAFQQAQPNGHIQLAKVYSLFFQLLNVAEELAVVRHRDQLEETEGYDRVSGLWGHTFQSWKSEGISETEALERIKSTAIEPVFTAHPTESKRTTVLEQLNALFDAFAAFKNTLATGEKEQAERKIKATLHRLWLTGEVYLAKPTVADELRNIVHYLSRTLPAALEKTDFRFVEAWKKAGWQTDIESMWRTWPQVTFGDWVGGDRDGHPFVTDAVTTSTLRELRKTSLGLVRSRLVTLAKQLSFSETMVPPPADFGQLIQERAQQFGEAGARALGRNRQEPWRQWANLLIAQLPVSEAGELHEGEGRYTKADDLVADLASLMDALHQANVATLARTEILPVIRLVQTFGFHLAHLDVRQNSRFHDLAITQLMQAAHIRNADSFATWSEIDRLRFLEDELRSPRPFTADVSRLGEEAKQAVRTLQSLRQHRDAFGG